MTEHGPSMTIEGVQAQIDRSLRHYATKADVEIVKTSVSDSETRIVKWVVITGISVGSAVLVASGVVIGAIALIVG